MSRTPSTDPPRRPTHRSRASDPRRITRRPGRAGLGRAAAAIVGGLASVVAIVFLVQSIDLGATGATLGRARVPLILASLLIIPVLMALRTWRWQALLPRRDDGRRVPRRP